MAHTAGSIHHLVTRETVERGLLVTHFWYIRVVNPQTLQLTGLTRDGMEALGFYVCAADLEDELIRALGADEVLRVVEAQGELGAFRTLQKQPAWQGRASEEQLHRFMGSGGSRKIRYARLLVDALDLTRVPRPLERVLAHV